MIFFFVLVVVLANAQPSSKSKTFDKASLLLSFTFSQIRTIFTMWADSPCSYGKVVANNRKFKKQVLIFLKQVLIFLKQVLKMVKWCVL